VAQASSTPLYVFVFTVVVGLAAAGYYVWASAHSQPQRVRPPGVGSGPIGLTTPAPTPHMPVTPRTAFTSPKFTHHPGT